MSFPTRSTPLAQRCPGLFVQPTDCLEKTRRSRTKALQAGFEPRDDDRIYNNPPFCVDLFLSCTPKKPGFSCFILVLKVLPHWFTVKRTDRLVVTRSTQTFGNVMAAPAAVTLSLQRRQGTALVFAALRLAPPPLFRQVLPDARSSSAIGVASCRATSSSRGRSWTRSNGGG